MSKITTASSVDALKPVPGRQVEYPDTKVTGLALRISPSGQKSWTVRYRAAGGVDRRMTIGRYPIIGLADARDMATDALRSVVRDKRDPLADRKTAKAAAAAKKLSTIGDLIEGYFVDAARGAHKPEGQPKRASTLRLEREY